MTVDEALTWLRDTPLSTSIRESGWIFPTIESGHVIAFVLVVGSIAVVDLRLLGLASRNRRADELTAELLPLTWIAFVLAAIGGTLLFIAKPVVYAGNSFFLSKMVLLLLAGLNMVAFHVLVWRRLVGVPVGAPEPIGAKISGGLSLALWIGVVACGRWIGFTVIG